MAVTQAYIDTLNQAIADGVRQVTLPGGQVTIFQTTESLIKARDDMRRELKRTQRQARSNTGYITYGGRGY